MVKRFNIGFLILIFASLLVLASCAGEQGAAGPQGPAGESGSTALSDAADLIAAARVLAATERYLDADVADEDGYQAEGNCVSSPAGAMGIHYGNHDLEGDGIIDATRPEILQYIPDGDGVRLVAVEYSLPIGDPGVAVADLTSVPSAPVLFGQTFDGPMDGHGPAGPPHYDLHVWLWEENPAGVFASMNPNLSCPE